MFVRAIHRDYAAVYCIKDGYEITVFLPVRLDDS
jgi:hypothetical protein